VTPGEELERSEVEAVLETRRELGLRYDTELVDGFADRIEVEVARRVGQQVESMQRSNASHRSAGPRQLALGIVSLVMGIPITAINIAAGDDPSMIGLMISWGGIAAVNVAHALQSRPR
jgi:hypothetical protein